MSPLNPNTPERLALRLQQVPAPLLDIWSAPAFAAVLSAIRLGVFRCLDGGPKSAEEVAAECGTDVRGTRLLLETLESLDYLSWRHGSYGLTRVARTWLTPGGSADLTPYYLYWGALTEHLLRRLDESVRTGSPPEPLADWLRSRPDVSRWYEDGLTALALMVAPEVIRALAVPATARRVIDIGGGHALYAVRLLERFPRLSAVVVDDAEAIEVGRRNIQGAKVRGRIALREADILHDPLPHGFDLALLINVVHGYEQADTQRLLRQTFQTLAPGGRVAVLEQIQGVTPMPLGRAAISLLSLGYFHLFGGQVHRFEDLRDWLVAAGFVEVERRNILRAGSAVVTAHRPA